MSVKKLIIPAAGYGTRFLPFTKSVPKEMLPILNKPLIHLAVEEAVASGIEEIILITYRGKTAIENYFDANYELEQYLEKNNKTAMLEEVKFFEGKVKIIFLRQPQMTGFAHAILMAKDIIGDEPFAVLLPDDLIVHETPALKQLVNEYNTNQKSILALEEVHEKNIPAYGIVSYSEKNNSSFKLKKVVEKPKLEDAPSNLAIVGRYIFTPQIFKYIEACTPSASGETYLTDAIEMLAHDEKEGVFGKILKGKRFDVGKVEGFIEANNYYFQNRNLIDRVHKSINTSQNIKNKIKHNL